MRSREHARGVERLPERGGLLRMRAMQATGEPELPIGKRATKSPVPDECPNQPLAALHFHRRARARLRREAATGEHRVEVIQIVFQSLQLCSSLAARQEWLRLLRDVQEVVG